VILPEAKDLPFSLIFAFWFSFCQKEQRMNKQRICVMKWWSNETL